MEGDQVPGAGESLQTGEQEQGSRGRSCVCVSSL